MHFHSRQFRAALISSTIALTLSTTATAEEGGVVYAACEGTPSESDISAARGAYQAGQVSFHEADYDRALLYWEDAFRRDCTAVKLLLNIARAYELSDDLDGAVNALQTYVERRPDAPDRSSVEKRIAKLQEKLDEEAAAAAAAAEAAKETAPPPEPEAQEAPEPVEVDNTKPLWPVFVTAGGGAVLITGGVLALVAQGAINSEKDSIAEANGCTRKGLNWSCPSDEAANDAQTAVDNNEEISKNENKRTTGYVLAAVGAVTAGVGGYLWYRTWNSPTGSAFSKTQLTPVIAPGYQGISLSGSF